MGDRVGVAGAGVGVAVKVGVGVDVETSTGTSVASVGMNVEVEVGIGTNVAVEDGSDTRGADGVTVDVSVGVKVSDGGSMAGVLRMCNIATTIARIINTAPTIPTSRLWRLVHNCNFGHGS